jgi:hypothetical protein
MRCDTRRKVTVSIPDEVIGFFSRPSPSSHTIALEPINPLTEKSIRNIPGIMVQPESKADIFSAIYEPII